MFGFENSSFLINLAVSLLIGLITLLYFRQQIASLNHKVQSMFSLLTSMTQELNNLSRLNFPQESSELEDVSKNENVDQRITVSDDDDEEEEDDDDDEGSDEDTFDDDDDSSRPVDLQPTEINLGSEIENNIKVIEMQGNNVDDVESSYDSDDEVELDDYDVDPDLSDVAGGSIVLLDEDANNIDLPLQELTSEIDLSLSNELQKESVKSIDVNIDYSKMSVKALKDLVNEKNLATNVSKLKKQELLDLLSK